MFALPMKKKSVNSDSTAPLKKKRRESSPKTRRIAPTLICSTKSSKSLPQISPVLRRNKIVKPKNLRPSCSKSLFKDASNVVSTNNVLTVKDIEVRRSVQTSSKMFIDTGKVLEQGVFTPRTRGGWTVDIVLEGRGVDHIHQYKIYP